MSVPSTKVNLPSPAVALGVLFLAALMFMFSLGGDSFVTALRYDREACIEGDLWRLISGHFVHLNWAHLRWNLLGLLLIVVLFSTNYRDRDWLLIFVASALTIIACFLIFEPELSWYVGFSGVLHGLFAAGLLAWLRTGKDPFVIAVSLLFVAKLVAEYLFGSLPFLQEQFSGQVIHSAHFYGTIGGGISALGAIPKR